MEKNLDNLDVYQMALEISKLAWEVFKKIPKSYYSISNQFIRAADSIGANLSEGYGRGTYRDRKHFASIARGSIYESAFWLNQIIERSMVSNDLVENLKTTIEEEKKLLMGYRRYLNKKIEEESRTSKSTTKCS